MGAAQPVSVFLAFMTPSYPREHKCALAKPKGGGSVHHPTRDHYPRDGGGGNSSPRPPGPVSRGIRGSAPTSFVV